MKIDHIKLLGYCPATLGGLGVQIQTTVNNRPVWLNIYGISHEDDNHPSCEQPFGRVSEDGEDFESTFDMDEADEKKYEELIIAIVKKYQLSKIAEHYHELHRKNTHKFFENFRTNVRDSDNYQQAKEELQAIQAEESDITSVKDAKEVLGKFAYLFQ